jgi:hypothetical protein
MRKTNFCVMLITYKRGELKNRVQFILIMMYVSLLKKHLANNKALVFFLDTVKKELN